MKTVTKLCKKVLWLNDGEFVKYGPTSKILPKYEKFMA